MSAQIVNKPPPLWEVPSTSNNFTAQVFRAGLQKEPDRRASAKELRRKTMQALRAGEKRFDFDSPATYILVQTINSFDKVE